MSLDSAKKSIFRSVAFTLKHHEYIFSYSSALTMIDPSCKGMDKLPIPRKSLSPSLEISILLSFDFDPPLLSSCPFLIHINFSISFLNLGSLQDND